MKNCTSCKWERLNPQGLRMIQCRQGHARTFEKVIENCHAWEEKKEECWWCKDFLAFEREYLGTAVFKIVKKLIGLNPEDPKCPICDRNLNG